MLMLPFPHQGTPRVATQMMNIQVDRSYQIALLCLLYLSVDYKIQMQISCIGRSTRYIIACILIISSILLLSSLYIQMTILMLINLNSISHLYLWYWDMIVRHGIFSQLVWIITGLDADTFEQYLWYIWTVFLICTYDISIDLDYCRTGCQPCTEHQEDLHQILAESTEWTCGMLCSGTGTLQIQKQIQIQIQIQIQNGMDKWDALLRNRCIIPFNITMTLKQLIMDICECLKCSNLFQGLPQELNAS